MPRIPRFIARERLSVEPYAGATAHGNAYGTAVTVRAAVEPMTRLITTPEGQEATAELAAYVRPPMPDVPVESRVTRQATGRVYRVLAVGDWPLGAGHELLLGSFAS